jgi:hypothetical protein
MLLTNGELITMFNFFKKKNKSTKTSITNIVINANCVIESGKHNYYDNIPRLNLEIVEKYTDGTKNLFKKKYLLMLQVINVLIQNLLIKNIWTHALMIIVPLKLIILVI